MKKLRTLVIAVTGVAAVAAVFAGGASSFPLGKAVPVAGDTTNRMVQRVDSDNDRDNEGHGWRWLRFLSDDEHERGEGHGQYVDDEDDGPALGGQNAPARAGVGTPPDNGLILKGSTPQVQVN